jgi:hypothetical protein
LDGALELCYWQRKSSESEEYAHTVGIRMPNLGEPLLVMLGTVLIVSMPFLKSTLAGHMFQ